MEKHSEWGLKKIVTSKLGRMFLSWFMILSLLPLVIYTLIHYQNTRSILDDNINTQLSMVSSYQSNDLLSFFDSAATDLRHLSHQQLIKSILSSLRSAYLSSQQPLKSFVNSPAWQNMQVQSEGLAELKNIRYDYQYDDLYLIDPAGNILFSVAGESDLGENLFQGALAGTKFSNTCREVIASNSLLYSDMEFYQPAGNRVTSFLVAPVPGTTELLGLIALQIPTGQINANMSQNHFLESIETYLIGMDGLMRSNSRFLTESSVLSKRITSLAAYKMLDYTAEMDVSELNHLSHSTGLLKYPDYRNIDVFGQWRLLGIFGIKLGVLTEIDRSEALLLLKNTSLSIILTIIVTVLLILFFALLITRSINYPILFLSDWMQGIAKGDLANREIKIPQNEIAEMYRNFKNLIESTREFAEICQAIAVGECSRKVPVRSEKDMMGIAINQISANYKNVINQAKKVATGDYSSTFRPHSEEDELGNALYNMISSLRYLHTKNNNENWLKTGINELTKRIQGTQDMSVLCDKIIRFVCMYLNIKIGALYLSNNNRFELVSSYALSDLENRQKNFKYNEGIIGQVAKEKKIQIFSDFPENYLNIQSGLVNLIPGHIVVIPLVYENSTVGVMELGLVNEPNELQLTFLKQIAGSIAITINLIVVYDRLHASLEKTEMQKMMLQNQKEELRVSNEELEEQTMRLQESEKRLQQQQEELRQTNEELEEHTAMLKKQKEQLQRKTLEIAETAAELQRISKYKSEFLANMSHELRTPLNSMLILAKLLSENKNNNLSSKQVEFATTIYSSGNDLLNLINEILDLAKIEAKKITLNIAKINIRDMAQGLIDVFKPVAAENKLKLSSQVHKDVPQYIITDEQRVLQILKNLMSNAFKFTAQGSIKLNVFFPKREAGLLHDKFDPNTTLAFEVIDTGIGIPADKQQLIFEAFQQVDSGTSRKYGGTGLGLSICRELVKLLKGEIRLFSEEGKGSRFIVFLPLSIETTMPAPEKEPQAQNSSALVTQDRNTVIFNKAAIKLVDDRDTLTDGDNVVLIIEDDNTFAEVLLNLTREHGFKGIVALRGDTGLELVKKYKPIGILLDISLPGIDGWSVLDRLKENIETRHIPVHIISGAEKEAQGLQMGAISFLKKPATLEQLNSVFEKLESMARSSVRRLLVVEDNKDQLAAIRSLLEGNDLEITTVETGKQAYKLLQSGPYDCIVLDLTLPDISGIDLLKKIRLNDEIPYLPIIIYTGKVLSDQERFELKEYAESIIVKDANCLELLLDQTSLFLHRVGENLSEQKKQIIKKLHNREEIFNQKKILIVDDDMRNVFALSAILEENGLLVEIAKNGKESIEYLEVHPDVDLILMDIMMPVMDGYTAIEYIRKMNAYGSVPVIALTAKAMRGDKEKCIQAGASDYLAKPINNDQLLSLLRVWLYKGY